MSDEEKINIPPWISPSDIEPVPESGAAPLSEKPKRKRRTKAEMLAAREAGMVPLRGSTQESDAADYIPGVKDRFTPSMIADLQVPVTIESLKPAMVPSLSPEAKARLIPQPTQIRIMFMKWVMVGAWLGYRNVSLALPFCCIKVSW